MPKQAKVVQKDNGYFEVWEKPNGEQVRIRTEDMQFSFRYSRGARTQHNARIRAMLAEEAA